MRILALHTMVIPAINLMVLLLMVYWMHKLIKRKE